MICSTIKYDVKSKYYATNQRICVIKKYLDYAYSYHICNIKESINIFHYKKI